jgi:hypothetical protein
VCLQARQCACTQASVRACRGCAIRQAGRGVSEDKRVLVKGAAGSELAGKVV